MKFNVIIGNPPYQMRDGGARASAKAIYHLFVEQAKRMESKYLVMITPSRWFAGGKGLGKYRKEMINDKRIRVLVDFPSSSECFPGVKIKGGVSYFLWDRDNEGECVVINMSEGKEISKQSRFLAEPGIDTLIRYNKAVEILRKVRLREEAAVNFDSIISASRPFGFRTYFRDYKTRRSASNSIKIYANKEVGYLNLDAINFNREWASKHKVYISRAYGAGEGFPHQIINKPFYGDINSICTETYLLIGPFDDKETAENVVSYMKTKFFRFMVMLIKNTQHATKRVYQLVPLQDFSKPWTDEELFQKYSLDKDEIAYIESMIRPME